ncbi:hypothetical protein CsSME_00030400 [Camellia sinensis var. sinensis]
MKCLGLLCLLATGLSTLSVGAVKEGLKRRRLSPI